MWWRFVMLRMFGVNSGELTDCQLRTADSEFINTVHA